MLSSCYGGSGNSLMAGNNCSLGAGLGSCAYGFVGDWVNIVVTLTVLQSILGLVCNWGCGNNSGNNNTCCCCHCCNNGNNNNNCCSC